MNVLNFFQLDYAFSNSLLSYKLDASPRPFSASLVVTNKCNIHCTYCNSPSLSEKELSINEISVIFG